jgi:hypothetical protein
VSARNRLKNALTVLAFLSLVLISYARYTYLINPNVSGEPLLLDYRHHVELYGAGSMQNIKSIFIYWGLFLLGNATLFFMRFSSHSILRVIVFVYAGLSFLSVFFLLIDRLVLPAQFLFNLGAGTKNLLLSPVFTVVSYVLTISFIQRRK